MMAQPRRIPFTPLQQTNHYARLLNSTADRKGPEWVRARAQWRSEYDRLRRQQLAPLVRAWPRGEDGRFLPTERLVRR
jgi:hypothetical protein